MQEIKINMSYSMNVNQSISQQLTNTIRQVHEQSQKSDHESDEKMMTQIKAKIKRGKKLSSKEESFLKEHDQDLYMQYLRIRKMAKALEEQLEHASTKEEANDIINRFLNCVPDKDPYKDAIINAMNEVIKEFRHSDGFQKLPTNSEDICDEQAEDINEESNTEDSFDPMSWTPLQDVIDSMPTFEMSS